MTVRLLANSSRAADAPHADLPGQKDRLAIPTGAGSYDWDVCKWHDSASPSDDTMAA